MKVKILPVLLFVLFVLFVWRLNIFSIDTVEPTNLAECVTTDQLNQEINGIGKNLILINQDKLKNKLISKYLCIKDINVGYKFPKTVEVKIYGRNLLAKVVSSEFKTSLVDVESSASSQAALLDWSFPAEASGEALVVDGDGYIFTKVKPESTIPTIFMDSNIYLGMKLDQKTFYSIDLIFSRILKIAPLSYQPNFKAKIYGETLLVNTSPRLAFSLENDILRQLASLQLILQKAKIDERVAEFIDLRFDKSVVQYRTNLSK